LLEFRHFLKEIERSGFEDHDVHIVTDNYAPHKMPAISACFARRPRSHVHSTPPRPSWRDRLDRSFAETTERQIRRGVHTRVKHLEDEIHAYIEQRDTDARPFTWVRTADEIVDTIRRFCLRACTEILPRTSSVPNQRFA
jgi:hypothetical protein